MASAKDGSDGGWRPGNGNWRDLPKRLLFGGLIAIGALVCTIAHPLTFYALLLIGAILMYEEWRNLNEGHPLVQRLGGLAYIGIPVWSLIALRSYEISVETITAEGVVFTVPEQTSAFVLYLFAVVWATDIAAYFGGKAWGRRKLAPHISPGKTWEGLAFGIAAAAIVSAIASFYVPFPSTVPTALLIGMILALVSQAGDLFESWLKRESGIKDSGALIPGHGGILDRVDGLVFAAPVYALMVFLIYGIQT